MMKEKMYTLKDLKVSESFTRADWRHNLNVIKILETQTDTHDSQTKSVLKTIMTLNALMKSELLLEEKRTCSLELV